ncbi:MAG: Rab family GTPase [Candidatus Helarchaeota archaeon]
MTEKMTYNFKIVLIGSPEVGKTSLVHKFVMNQFKTNYIATLGVNIMIKDVQLKKKNKEIQLSIWDVGGQEKWARVRYMYYKGASAVIVVYDITNSETLEAVPELIKEFKESIGEKEVPLILLGNKVDLEDKRTVDTQKGDAMKTRINAMDFFETSAKEGILVEEAFLRIAEELVK